MSPLVNNFYASFVVSVCIKFTSGLHNLYLMSPFTNFNVFLPYPPFSSTSHTGFDISSHTRYDVMAYFRLAVIKVRKKRSELPPPTALGGISRERFEQRSQNFTRLSWKIGPTNLLHLTSLAVSGWLHNAMRYCTKVRKTGLASQRVE